MVLGGTHLYLSPSLPSVESLRDIRLQTPLRIYSADNKLIGEFGEMRRIPINYDDIPQYYIDALLAAEDDQFYSHHGVSISGLMRATSHLLMTGDKKYGGSTITMQVARNYFLSKRKKFKRKFNEILLALRIERELTKHEILELYVNVIFLGNRAYGIQAAAQVYYGEELNNLTLAQLAMLAGLPKAPSSINPLANPTKAIERRNWILSRMLELGKIDQNTFDQTILEPITARYHGNNLELGAPYIAEMARKEAIDRFGKEAYTEGYRIYTTVDSALQKKAQSAVIQGLDEYQKRHGYRGPEQNLLNGTTVSTPFDDDTLIRWQETLSDIPSYGNLEAAAILSIHPKEADESESTPYLIALRKDGTEIQIPWENGLSSLRQYITEDRRGPKIKHITDLLSVGDVIRIKAGDEGWYISQVPTAQAALVSLDATDGAIISLVGGFDFQQSHFNRILQAKRQPGSNFKPFIYTTALENGFTAATTVNDAPIVFEDEQLESTWRPENSSKKFYGPTRLRKALYRSINLVSIRLLQNLGINTAIQAVERFGFDPSTLPRDLSLALGSLSVPPMDIVKGYSSFANGGYSVDPYFIDKITMADGEVIYQATPATVCEECDDNLSTQLQTQDNVPFVFDGDPFDIPTLLQSTLGLERKDYLPQAPRIIDERTSYLIDSMLKDVVRFGTGTKARVLGRSDLAGKTGTTNGPTDAWFSGYSGELVTTAWVGFDDNSKLGRREYGGSAALPIWIDFMGEALKGRPVIQRPLPQGMVTVKIDPDTGKRARVGDPDAIFEIFKEESVPEEDSSQPIPTLDNSTPAALDPFLQ